jgi:hypothetical protein
MRASFVAAAAALASIFAGASARGDALSASESDQLVRGGTVTRLQAVSQGDERYVGGVAYAVVYARADELAALLDDVDGWRRVLPHTREARQVGTSAGDAIVELTHGSALLQVTYSLRVRREGNVVRFWLDRSRPHGIEDAWGFLRAEPLDTARTLVTYGILIDMGAGLLRSLFEDRVRRLALTVPERVRGLLLERRMAFADSLATAPGARY